MVGLRYTDTLLTYEKRLIMSRGKRNRTMKGKLDIKTGSKKSFIKDGEKGKIPSHNRLAKHKNRQKSAYQRFLEENKQKDTSAGPKFKPSIAQKAEVIEPSADKYEKKDEPTKDFNKLSGDELLDLFN